MKFERIEYSDHAIKRMKQRGMTELEIEHVLTYPTYIKKSYLGRKEAVGTVKNRTIKVAFEEIETYIRIVSVM